MGNNLDPEPIFGDVLRHYRRAADMTQEELAEKAHLSVRGLSDLERGVNRLPRRETVFALAEALKLGEDDRAVLLRAARGHSARPAKGSAEVGSADSGASLPGARPPTDPPEASGTSSPAATTVSEPATAETGSGAQLASPAEQAADCLSNAPQLVEQRRLVTVLFADPSEPPEAEGLADASLDPEHGRERLARYHDLARHIIGEHGGSLEQRVGDTVMAVFGVPRAHGDDVARALAAALALRAGVACDALLAGRLLVHIGINTGEVLTSLVASAPEGRPDAGGAKTPYPVPTLPESRVAISGDVVRVAARLYNAAGPGEILAGERTVSAADASFEFGAPEDVDAQGRRGALRAFPLVGSRRARRSSRPPFVGRRHELAQLNLLYDRVIEERRLQFISIVAPAGTGKSRLAEEFLAQLDPAVRERAAIAACPPYGPSLTFWPLRHLLSALFGAELPFDALAATFVRAGYAADDAARLAGAVLAPLSTERAPGEPGSLVAAGSAAGSLAAGGSGERESIFLAWRLLLEALAREAPRIIVWEDLHWASDSMLDLVEYLMHMPNPVPLLFIALSRPDLTERRPNWGGGRNNYISLTLPPLSPAATRQLVELLGERVGEAPLPAATSEEIASHSGGNPFFAAELIRSVTAPHRGRIPPGSAAADVAPSGGTGQATSSPRIAVAVLPDSIYEALQAQLDELSAIEREVLNVGAVAGRTFHLPALRAVLAERPETAVAAAVDELLGRDLIIQIESETYTFRHMLIREVAYRNLSRPQRMRLHATIASVQEARAGDRVDEVAELIAYHYREAAQLSRQAGVAPPFPVARAVDFLVRAGEVASRVGALAEASDFMRDAIDLAPEAEHLRLYELLGDCATLGEPSLEGYTQALARWRLMAAQLPASATPSERGASAREGARLLRKLVFLYLLFPGTLEARLPAEEVGALLEEGLRLAQAAGDEDERWRLRVVAQWLPDYRGHYTPEEIAQGCATALAASDYFEARGDWAWLSRALDAYTVLCIRESRFAEALEATKRRLAVPSLPSFERGDAVATIAGLYYEHAEFHNCIGAMREALRAVRPGDAIVHLDMGVLYATMALYESGCWSALDEFLAPLAALWEQAQKKANAGQRLATGYLYQLLVALGREDRAAADEAASIVYQTMPERLGNMRAMVRAICADDPSQLTLDPAAGVHGLRPLIALCSEHGVPTPDWVIRDLRAWDGDSSVPIAVKAAIAKALAAGDDARLADAIEEAQRRGFVVHAARMRIVLAKRTGDRGQLDQAKAVLERIGDRQGLRRLARVADRLT